jgi:hypothetical protein
MAAIQAPKSASSTLDIASLLRATALVLRCAAPTLALALVMLGALQIAHLLKPDRTTTVRTYSVEHYIVEEQVRRIESISTTIGFLGDSSCLMGVDAQRLGHSLRGTESFCTLAYLGPAGYATMLQRAMDKGRAPQRLVLMLHPTQFIRDSHWDVWVKFIGNDLRWPDVDAPQFPYSSLDFLRFEGISRAFYNPLLGQYGRYYGSEQQFRDTITAHNGSAIDPNGLALRGRSEAAAVPSTPVEPFGYSFNNEFLEALRTLRIVLAKYGTERVSLVISPVPENTIANGTVDRDRDEAALRIAALLGLPDGAIIDTPDSYPAGFFTH